LRLTTAVRRLAFDRTLPPWEALGRIRDAFHDYDHRGGHQWGERLIREHAGR
jgi:hypothetical protein